MTVPLQIGIALGSIAVLLGLMAAVRRLAQTRHIAPEVQRKLVHIGTGLYALTLPWIFTDRWPVYGLVGLTLLVMAVLRLPHSRLGSTLHGVGRRSWGDLLLALSVGVCLFLAQDDAYLYVLPIAVLTLADAAAALAGTTYGSRFFVVEDGIKSVEGSVVFFAVTLLISIVCLMLMTPYPPANVILLSVMIAAFGTLVEAVSWRGFDNLFLPVALLLFLQGNVAAPLADLVALAAIFAISIVWFRRMASQFGLTDHAARVYVITVFVLLSVTAPQNTLFPVLALAAHVWARTARPCDGAHPALDIAAALALVSLGWLTIGTATGWTAIAFYGLTTIGMMTALCAIAVTARPAVQRLAMLAAVAGVTCAIWSGIVALNGSGPRWHGPMWSVLLVTLGFTGLVPSVKAHWFGTARVTRITLLALIVPVTIYAINLPDPGWFLTFDKEVLPL